MATLYVHHQVADYAKWRQSFDQLRADRVKYGETGERVLQTASNPNEITVLVEFGTADQARAWGTSTELKEGMKEAGVLSQPEVLILQDSSNAQQITSAVLHAIEAQDFAAARALLSDDFQFSGATPNPLTADQWLGVHRALAAAMSDFSFKYHPTGGSATEALGTVQVGGTHDGTFNPPMPGLPAVPATGKQIRNPVEHISATAKNGKLVEYNVEHVANGGLPGILAQMGAAVPA